MIIIKHLFFVFCISHFFGNEGGKMEREQVRKSTRESELRR
jgi:hypothetical protein